MKLLHTADWHVGRMLRGRSRADEQRAVLAEIIEIARAEAVDIVIVAGDLFDASAPTPEAEQIVYRALLGLADVAPAVVIIAGNHDHPQRFLAVRPLLELGRVHAASYPNRPDEGGVIDIRTRTGETARLALLPFLSQRGIVTADLLMAETAARQVETYADRYAALLAQLTASFDAAFVNIVVAHPTVVGARLGGGEREAHTLQDYHVTTNVFPASAHYVALGHIHRAQRLSGPCPIWYSGSPIQLDFGEAENQPCVLLVEAEPGIPARVKEVPLRQGRPLRTLRGSLDALSVQASAPDDAYLRVIVEGRTGASLADDVRLMFPNVVDVSVARSEDATRPAPSSIDTVGQSPRDLFAQYLTEKELKTEELTRLFDELLEAIDA